MQALRAANISNVACGAYASYAVTAAGEVYAWGSNSFGQLGLGPAEAAIVPLPKVVQWLRAQRAVIYELFGGQRTVFAMEQSGKVYAIGNNEFGMLALGDETTRNIPATLADLVGNIVSRAICVHMPTCVCVCVCPCLSVCLSVGRSVCLPHALRRGGRLSPALS